MVGIVHSLYRRIVQYCISFIYLQVKKKAECDCNSSFGRSSFSSFLSALMALNNGNRSGEATTLLLL